MTIYSHSRLGTYESCPLKFKYHYIDEIETEVENTIEAFMGDMVHQTLEKLYNDLKFQKQNTVEELLDFFYGLWEKNYTDGILIVREQFTPENYKDMGVKFIRDYYKSHFPFTDSTIVACEPRILVDLDGTGRYQLQGYIDRLATKGDVYEIHDYKTNSTLPEEEYLKKDRQLALYSIAVRKKYQDAKKIKLIWHFLAFDKDFCIEKSEAEIEQLKCDTMRLIDEIESATEFEPKVSALCSWCEFQKMCPKWKHKFETKDLLKEDYLKDDGVALVNRYMEIKKKSDMLNSELESIKDMIYDLCKKKECDVLFGSDHRITCKEYVNYKFPYKNEPKRKALEIVLKDLGLFDKVSDVDVFKLSKMVQNKEFSPEIIEVLKQFGKLTKVRRIYSGKKNW